MNRLYYPAEIRQHMSIEDYRAQDNKSLLALYDYNNPGKAKQKLDKKYSDIIKIVVYSPSLDNQVGGIMVLNNFIKTISNLPYENMQVYVYFYDHIEQHNEFCNNFFNPFHIDDNTVVIYPEVVSGNPLNAKHVIRWILLDLGLEMPSNYYLTWGDNDLVYHWEPSSLPNSKQLVNIWIDPVVIANLNAQIRVPRKYNCFGIRKLKHIPKNLHKDITFFHKREDLCIDDKNIGRIIQIFQKSNLFYCYDPNTFFSVLAPLFGCVTVLHPLAGYKKDEYFKSRILYNHKKDILFDYGIAYGNSAQEINRAKESVDIAEKNFFAFVESYKHTVIDMLNDIYDLVENNISKNNTVKNIYNI